MDLKELNGKLPQEVIYSAAARGIEKLTPPQELAVKYGLLTDKNFVISAPTASGKTFIAEMAMLRSIMLEKRKAVYIGPMRALVSEKYFEFKDAYPKLKVAMSIGEIDSLDSWLENYDIIFVSTEKFDSLIRHGLSWLDSIGCIVFDEIHMLDDVGRGPTLEILMSRLRRICRNAQIVALSATIGNSKELAEWLDAELIESNYRPVLLEKGVELNGEVTYDTERTEKLSSGSKLPEMRVTEDTLHKGKQLIIFYSTKRNAESGAEKLSKVIGHKLSKHELEALGVTAEQILGVLSKPTLQCEKLAKAVAKGVAFHHSGLVNEQRHIIEEAFKRNELKALCSTTTLGFGVNLPAHTVLVRDTTRYGEMEGSEKLGINEVVQLFGRAGRPKYDSTGRALLIARTRAEQAELYDRYINGELEPITSKLGMLPVLRTHILAFISTRFLTSEESILDFLGSTFYGYQYSSMYEIKQHVAEILKELVGWGFIEKGSGSVYRPTRLGARVSELYIDPLSAKWLIDTLPMATDELSLLFTICNTIEMRPHVKASEKAITLFPQYQHLLQSSDVDYERNEMVFYDPLRAFSTAAMLGDWIEELGEPLIVKEYGTTPGALFSKVTNADWLLYSCTELAKLLRISPIRIIELRVRAKYGIKRELLDLIRLEQVGRVRARMMHENGIKTVSDLRKEGSGEKIERLFGREIAKRIMGQLDSA